MSPIILALISLFSWGTGDIFTTSASRKIGSFNASFYGYFFGAILSSLYIPFALHSLSALTLPMVLLTVILSVIQLLAFLSYNEALKIGNSALVGTIAGSFTSIVVILSLLFLGESLSMQQGTSILIIFVGLLLATINISSLKKPKTIINRGTFFALLAMAGWAIYFTFIKLPVKESGFFWPSYITTLVGTVGFLLFGLKRIKRPHIELRSGFPAVFMSGLLLSIGSFAFNSAIDKGLSSIVAPIAGAYPALFALLAYFIFKDPITRQQKIGMVVTLLGIILLGYFSG